MGWGLGAEVGKWDEVSCLPAPLVRARIGSFVEGEEGGEGAEKDGRGVVVWCDVRTSP